MINGQLLYDVIVILLYNIQTNNVQHTIDGGLVFNGRCIRAPSSHNRQRTNSDRMANLIKLLRVVRPCLGVSP